MRIEIFDIDGTLTYDYSDCPRPGYSTYEYWFLITQHFTSDRVALDQLVEDWRKAMAAGEKPSVCTWHLMQQAVQLFKNNPTAQLIRDFAKEITQDFIKCGVIQNLGIEHLIQRVNDGTICILATGGYEDGALGFLDGLVAGGLMDAAIRNQIRLTGTVVDWEKKVILHANVKELKIVSIERVLCQTIASIKPTIQAVYGNDPWFNDSEILALAPKGKAFVIPCCQNQKIHIPDDYVYAGWESIALLEKNL